MMNLKMFLTIFAAGFLNATKPDSLNNSENAVAQQQQQQLAQQQVSCTALVPFTAQQGSNFSLPQQKKGQCGYMFFNGPRCPKEVKEGKFACEGHLCPNCKQQPIKSVTIMICMFLYCESCYEKKPFLSVYVKDGNFAFSKPFFMNNC